MILNQRQQGPKAPFSVVDSNDQLSNQLNNFKGLEHVDTKV